MSEIESVLTTRLSRTKVNLLEHQRIPPERRFIGTRSTCRLTFFALWGTAFAMTDRLDLVFAALSDPTRRAILTLLLEDDMAVTDVAEPFEMSLAAISKHLQILTRAGLIEQEKRGRVKWCKLEPTALRDASIWMESFGQFEHVNLDAFEIFLEQSQADLSSDGP